MPLSASFCYESLEKGRGSQTEQFTFIPLED